MPSHLKTAPRSLKCHYSIILGYNLTAMGGYVGGLVLRLQKRPPPKPVRPNLDYPDGLVFSVHFPNNAGRLQGLFSPARDRQSAAHIDQHLKIASIN